MKTVFTKDIKRELKEAIMSSMVTVEDCAARAINKARECESADYARFALDTIIMSNEIALKSGVPTCQDTGMAVIFCEVGQDCHIVGEPIGEAINAAVREAYREGYFRKSVLLALDRINTGDNTPAVIHYEIVSGEDVTISFMAKGFGSENMSRVYMLKPAEGIEGVISSVVKTVEEAGGSSCPPLVVGVGIGGTMEKAALLSKKALLRTTGEPNSDKRLAKLENEILTKINALKIGAGGFGGDTTALAVHIEEFPTHIAGLPLAVNLQCHAVRHKTVVIYGKEV